jgi:predicted nucleic acid-binding protein
LLFYEVTNALHRYHRHGWMKEGTVRSALEAALALPVELHGDASLHERALEMATELGLAAAYDAHYLALAERLRAEFWTADGKLVRAVGARFDWVRLLGS